MGSAISKVGDGVSTLFLKTLHGLFQLFPIPYHKWWPTIFGLLPLIVHRSLLQKENLYPAAIPKEAPGPVPKYRPDDGYGTDVKNPAAGATGSALGRNVTSTPLAKRFPSRDPPVQVVAAKLLQRRQFAPAGMQLNVIAAAWIQAMVHDWVGHFDDPKQKVTLDKGSSKCPLKSFSFQKTLEGKAGPPGENYESFRTQWWDASFVYGQTEAQVKQARTFEKGQLKINPNHPNTLAQKGDVNAIGDNKNSWLGVALLQELFVKEHNEVAQEIAKHNPKFTDEELFHKARLVVAALVAKIHTVDWTVELLKTRLLEIGMKTNWYGLPRTLGFPKWFPAFFRLTGHDKSENHGVPFCLTEDFAAVYRLHPLLPDRLIIEGRSGKQESIPLEDLVGPKGDANLRKNADRPVQFWDSVLKYPCGNLQLHNYPTALRNVLPTDDEGRQLGKEKAVDLAALDLWRDRERGIPKFNNFRRAIGLKPYRSWKHMTGSDELARELEEVYDDIEDCDLLVGDLAEKKIQGFAISETSFVIFLLMASRRLESDPFLNQYLTPEYYTEEGLAWLENTASLKDVLRRHYPSLVKGIDSKESAFKPRVEWPTE